MWSNLQLFEDLVTFTEEILNGKLHFCALLVVIFVALCDMWFSLWFLFIQQHQFINRWYNAKLVFGDISIVNSVCQNLKFFFPVSAKFLYKKPRETQRERDRERQRETEREREGRERERLASTIITKTLVQLFFMPFLFRNVAKIWWSLVTHFLPFFSFYTALRT